MQHSRISKMVFFTPSRSQYHVLHDFTHKLAEAFERQGVECIVLKGDKSEDFQKILKMFILDPPDCSLSFNGLLPDVSGGFFCDNVQVPHVAVLVDPPYQFMPLIESPHTIVACVDRYFFGFFEKTKSTHQALFLPHAVDKNVYESSKKKRNLEIAMLASCIDYEKIRSEWKNKYSPLICKTLDSLAEKALTDSKVSFMNALVELTDISMELLGELDLYIRGRDRVALIREMSKVRPVHVFGGGFNDADWNVYFSKNQKDVIVHEKVSFEQAIEIMKSSKVILNSCPQFRFGAHERIFNALACGAMVITNDNDYLRGQFQENEGVFLYQYGDRDRDWEDIQVKLGECLNNEKLRREMVERGCVKVQQHHTWDNRAKTLLEVLPGMLQKLNLEE